MLLAIVRHGETDYNFNRLIQGRMDNPLNQNGRNQASSLSEILINLNEEFDALGSSPLIRASETAKIIGENLNLPISFLDERFVERDFGKFDGMSIDEAMPFISSNKNESKDYEYNEALEKRIFNGVIDLYQYYHGKKVLLVAHSHVIKALLVQIDPNKYDYMKHYVGNSSIVYFKVGPKDITFIKQIDL